MAAYQHNLSKKSFGFVALFVILITAQPLSAETVKIMPLGDSITEAINGHASYRYWLWYQLKNAGFDIDFVGSMRRAAPCCRDYDWDHEGHWGWRADQILTSIDRWASTYRPDIVLIHLGTNDINQGQSVNSTRADLAQIIDRIRAYVPDVVVLIAQIIPGNIRHEHQIRKFNKAISTLGMEKASTLSPIIVVDQWTGFNYAIDTYDGIHPNEIGEKKMAHKWFEALQDLKKISDQK